MKQLLYCCAGLACIVGAARFASAATVTVQNPSFEQPTVTGNGGLYQTGTPTSWTGASFSAQYIENGANGGFTGQPGLNGSQYIADDVAANATGTLTQDLGVAFQPNTTYTVDLAGGHRTNFAGVVMQFGLQSSTAPGTDLPGATIGFLNENALATSTFVDASAAGANGGDFTFTTGSSVPSGNLLAFIRGVNASGASERLHADNFRVTTTPAPEPASLALVGLGSLGLLARRRPSR